MVGRVGPAYGRSHPVRSGEFFGTNFRANKGTIDRQNRKFHSNLKKNRILAKKIQKSADQNGIGLYYFTVRKARNGLSGHRKSLVP